MSSFGVELRRLRKRAGLSQEALADRAGLSPEAVSLLERGRRTPRMTTLRLLADALRLPDAARRALFQATTARPARTFPPPTFADALIGRTTEVDNLTAILAEQPERRLVTVTGPGGVGKTRVAAAAVADLGPLFPDGIRWLGLAGLNEAESFLPAVGAALGVPHSPPPTPAVIIDHLAGKQLLIVFDAGEHLRATLSEFCARVLSGAPGVRLVLTNRELLQIPGESWLAVSPLALPRPGAAGEQLLAAPACQLFVNRSHGLTLGPGDAERIAQLCRRLDGLPLAIELAAARTSILTVQELAGALDRSSGILRSGAGGVDPLRATVDWSYRLLMPAEQLLLCRLSVFGGSFTREAAVATCDEGHGELGLLDLLASLVTKSLVVRIPDHNQTARFTLLQVIRAYAREQLEGHAGMEDLHRRHAHYYTQLAERAAPHLTGAVQDRWLSILDRDVSNLRRAVQWAAVAEPETALRLVGALLRWCYLRGRYAEGRRWADEALRNSDAAAPGLRAQVLHGAGMLAFLQCEYDLARSLIQASLDLYVALGDDAGIAGALARLGAIAREQSDYQTSIGLHSRALEISRRLADHPGVGAQLNFLSFAAWLSGDLDRARDWADEALDATTRTGDGEGVAWALLNSAMVARYTGDIVGSELLLQQSLKLSEEISYREGIAWSLNQLGVAARLNDRYDEAVELLRSSLAQHRDLGDRWRAASVLDELAACAIATGAATDAAAFIGTADRLRREIGTPVPAIERASREATVKAVRNVLGVGYRAAVIAGMTGSV